jgi:acyl-CoA thioesterase-2
VVAQALWAATHTVSEKLSAHSLHAYFVRACSLQEPIRYSVFRVRDGRSFATRRVSAVQSVGEILTMLCSFHIGEDGPAVAEAVFPGELGGPENVTGRFDAGVERRDCVFSSDPPRVATWTQFPTPLDEDPRLHACALAYLSDLNAIDAAVAAHPDPPEAGQWSTAHACVSLDHSVWFHRPTRAEDWLLFDLTGKNFEGVRAFATGRVFERSGEHVATVAQEGLFRPRQQPPG